MNTESEFEAQKYQEPNGCPTENAALKREWGKLTTELESWKSKFLLFGVTADQAAKMVAGWLQKMENDREEARGVLIATLNESTKLRAERDALAERMIQIDEVGCRDGALYWTGNGEPLV